IKRFGSVHLVTPGEPAPPPLLKDPLLSLSTRKGDSRTIGGDDVLAATTIRLSGDLRQRALTEAREAAGRPGTRGVPAVLYTSPGA
ncbi:hypothetical protein AB0B38_19995, partial [Streptomyces eurythermus]